MASANSAFTDIVTTSLQGYSKTLADNVTNHNALLLDIEERGNTKTATGRTIVQELEYAENSTTKFYSGNELLDTSQSEVFSAAEFNYKQLAGNVVISGLEEIQNSGPEAVHNLLESRIKNLENSLRNTIATAVYADGTGTSGKEIGGLQLIVADTVTNTVGGIDASSFSFWQNSLWDFSVESVTASATTIQNAMNQTWLRTIRGTNRPTTIVADAVYYTFYWDSLQANQRFTNDRRAAAGFTNIMFMAAPVIYDDQCPASHMYMLNSEFLHWRPAVGRNFKPLGERASINQDALIVPMVWAGNMTCSNRARQAVMHA